MKIVGYLIALVGLVGVAVYSIPQIRQTVPFLSKILTQYKVGDTILIAVSAVLLLIGIFLVMRGGSGGGRQAQEVPIYRGKNIVGYRRLK
jgi:hypothetical protein